MILSVWDIPACDPLAEAFRQAGARIVRAGASESKRLLDSSEVDAAMLAPNLLLRDTEGYTVIPHVALASRSQSPFVTVVLDRPINEVRLIESLERDRPVAELVEIVMREQYGQQSDFRIRFSESGKETPADAHLLVGEADSSDDTEQTRVDIGQEWYELTGLPMVWALLVVRTGGWSEGIVDLAERAAGRLAPGAEQELDVIYALSPDVVAGLDELAHYLFYFGKVDDIPSPKFTQPPESLQPSA